MTVSDTQFRAYCIQAAPLWARVDVLELKKRAEQKELLSWEQQLPTANRLAHQRIGQLEASLGKLKDELGAARLVALRAAEQATALRWGVRLGHAYAVYRDGRREADELKVDFLRPAADELGQFLCLGSSLGVTYLFVLGKDAVRFEATGPGNIVSLMPFSRARQGR